MKTSVRIITLFVVLTFIISNLVLAQDYTSGRTTRTPTTAQSPQTKAATDNSYAPPWSSSSSEPPAISLSEQKLVQADQIVQSEMEAYEEASKLEQEIIQAERQRQLVNNLRNFTISTGTSTGINKGSDNILVIPTEEVGFEELLTINEDMNVMSRIFANELGRQRTAASNPEWSLVNSQWVPNYESILGRRTNNLSSMYLQGYGALFMMKVDFPLYGPSDTKQQQAETEKEDVDKVWEQTRQQIYEPHTSSTGFYSRRENEAPEVKYDAQRVENLKTTLIQSLKHAANIRALKQDESVIVRVDGSSRSITVLSATKRENDWLIEFESDGIRRKMSINIDMDDFVRRFSVPMCIDIRAKKSDINAFAKGELDFDKFREKVQVLSYPLLGRNTGGTPVSRTRSTGTAIVTR